MNLEQAGDEFEKSIADIGRRDKKQVPFNKKIQFAFEVALAAHDGQKRKDNDAGMPYFIHPIHVVTLLFDMGVTDTDTLVVAALHDVLEDSKTYSEADMRRDFGDKVTDAVKELTLYDGMDKPEYLRSFKGKSLMANVVKAADRLCNVRDFQIHNPDYAAKYFDKANEFFENLYVKMEEIKSTYGETLARGLAEVISSMYKMSFAKRLAKSIRDVQAAKGN